MKKNNSIFTQPIKLESYNNQNNDYVTIEVTKTGTVVCRFTTKEEEVPTKEEIKRIIR